MHTDGLGSVSASDFHALMRWSQYKNLKEIIVTENGAAFEDRLC